MKVQTHLKAGKSKYDIPAPPMAVGKDCKDEATRGLCVDCCIEENGGDYGNACQARCGRFYKV